MAMAVYIFDFIFSSWSNDIVVHLCDVCIRMLYLKIVACSPFSFFSVFFKESVLYADVMRMLLPSQPWSPGPQPTIDDTNDRECTTNVPPDELVCDDHSVANDLVMPDE